VNGKAGDDDIRAALDADGTMLRGGAGDDILRGGRYNDILIGGSGDDWMFGGIGADQFRFFGNEIEGAKDRDRIFDLAFGDGDVLVFGSYAAGTFTKGMAGVNGFSSGTAAVISSYEGIVNAATFSDNVTAKRASLYNDNLLLIVTNGTNGAQQEILITGGWSQYVAAGGTDGL
jgi:Ca2+-binding RTX toxin-like protein